MPDEKIQRVGRSQQSGENKGEGSVYVIPRSDMPEGLVVGKKMKISLIGLIGSIDESGAVMDVERISAEELQSREDPVQKRIEEGLNINLSIKK